MHPLPEFRRRNPWAVFGLLALTLGIYGAVWLRRQGPAFDARLPSRPIGGRFAATVLLVTAAAVGAFLVDLASDGSLRGIEGALSGLSSGLLLLAALRVRRRIQHLAETPGSPPPRVSLLGTLLGNVAYLQARINRYSEALTTPHWALRVRPFRDSRRIAWIAALGLPGLLGSLVLLLVLGTLAADGVGTLSFNRARERASQRLAPPAEGRLTSSEPGLHPILEGGEALALEDSEKELVKRFVEEDLPLAGPAEDLRVLEAVLERNREPLRRAERILRAPRRGLGLDYPTTGDGSFPPSLVHQFALARLLFLDGTLELLEGRPRDSLPAIRRLGALAQIYEEEVPLVPLLAGVAIERLQLRLLGATLEACPDRAARTALGPTLLGRPMAERLEEALAYEAALLIQFEGRESRALLAEPAEDRSLLTRGMPGRAGRALLRYSTAGALDWLVRQADLYDDPYSAMKRELSIEPEELGFLEGLRILGTNTDWTLPAKVRAVDDSRRGAAFATAAPRAGSPGGGCASARSRLGTLGELYEVDEDTPGGCVLRYRLREDFEATTRGALPPPVFTWRIACG